MEETLKAIKDSAKETIEELGVDAFRQLSWFPSSKSSTNDK